jgi:hypothetical protein
MGIGWSFVQESSRAATIFDTQSPLAKFAFIRVYSRPNAFGCGFVALCLRNVIEITSDL